MNIDQQMDHFFDLSQQLRAKERAPTTPNEKQAAVIIEEFEKCLYDLIMEKMPVHIIQASIFYFWVTLEAPMRGVGQHKIGRWSMPLDKAIHKIMYTVQTTLNSLPDPEQSPEMQEFGDTVEGIKAHIPDDHFSQSLSREELTFCSTYINTRIHTVTSNFLKQSFHPEIVANVIFSRWLRLTTMHASTPETYYQKMEHYFEKVIAAARNYIPKLFQG